MKPTNKLIIIPASLGRNTYIRLSPSYLSNECWALAKTRLLNAGVFSTVDSATSYFPKSAIIKEITDDEIQKINTCITDPQQYTATHYCESANNGEFRFFVHTVSGDLVQFDRKSLALLKLDREDAILWGHSSGKGAFRDTQEASEMTLLLAPRLFDGRRITVDDADMEGAILYRKNY